MPGEIIGEFILRPLVELVLQVLCYFTGRLLVKTATLGQVYVDPAPKGIRVVVPKWHGFHRGSDGRVVVDCEMAALIGLVFWFAVAIGVYFVLGNVSD